MHPVPRFSTLIVMLCASTALADNAFNRCGRLVSGVECVLFESDTGGLFVLSDHGQFNVGDRVRVRGTLVSNCISICMQGNGCIDVSSIEPCLPAFNACGLLIQGTECVLLRTNSGATYALSDLGDFGAGDRVRVRGVIDADCVSICQEGDGCIQVESIRACRGGIGGPGGRPPWCGVGIQLLPAAALGMIGMRRSIRRTNRRQP